MSFTPPRSRITALSAARNTFIEAPGCKLSACRNTPVMHDAIWVKNPLVHTRYHMHLTQRVHDVESHIRQLACVRAHAQKVCGSGVRRAHPQAGGSQQRARDLPCITVAA